MGKYKILWQSSTAISGLPAYAEAIKKHSKKILGPDYQLEIKGVDSGSMDLHYNYVQYLNDYNILNNILKAEADGYDAVAIGCFSILSSRRPGRSSIFRFCLWRRPGCFMPACMVRNFPL